MSETIKEDFDEEVETFWTVRIPLIGITRWQFVVAFFIYCFFAIGFLIGFFTGLMW